MKSLFLIVLFVEWYGRESSITHEQILAAMRSVMDYTKIII
ncbi:MAG: hypothetical protein ACLVEJ_14625 [Parabacteroides sp.]